MASRYTNYAILAHCMPGQPDTETYGPVGYGWLWGKKYATVQTKILLQFWNNTFCIPYNWPVKVSIQTEQAQYAGILCSDTQTYLTTLQHSVASRDQKTEENRFLCPNNWTVFRYRTTLSFTYIYNNSNNVNTISGIKLWKRRQTTYG
jgi:hypothetical protein